MKTGIYKITNLINGKSYIGQSIHVEKRWKEHKKHMKSIYKDNMSYLHRAIRKYGLENFKFEIIEECSKEELDEKERYWISYYHTWLGDPECNGYNITDGGKQGRKAEPEYLDEIYQMLREDYTYKEIGEKFDLTPQFVSELNLGKHYTKKDTSYPIRIFKNIKNKNYCIDCGCEINNHTKRCKKCNNIYKSLILSKNPNICLNIQLLSKHQLLEDFHELISVKKVAEKYGYSSLAISKLCKKLGIEIQDKHKMEEQYRKEILGEETEVKNKRVWGRKIIQLDLNRNIINIFNSIKDIDRKINLCGVNIYGKLKRNNFKPILAYNYLWQYYDTFIGPLDN